MALDTIGGKVTDASQLKSRILLLEIHSDWQAKGTIEV
jgi:hypothetical protein